MLHGIKILQGDNKLFVSMPSKKVQSGVFQDVIHPINNETRELFEKTVLEQYKKDLDEKP